MLWVLLVQLATGVSRPWWRGVVWPASFQGVSSGEGGFWTPSMGVAGGKFVASSLQE